MSAYFVAATGTDIGKTFVTARLLRYLREAGRREAQEPASRGRARANERSPARETRRIRHQPAQAENLDELLRSLQDFSTDMDKKNRKATIRMFCE